MTREMDFESLSYIQITKPMASYMRPSQRYPKSLSLSDRHAHIFFSPADFQASEASFPRKIGI